MKSINLMRHHTVKTLSNAESITEEIQNSPTRTLTQCSWININFTKDAVNTVWWENWIYELCADGHPDCLAAIENELENDPRKHMWEISDPDHPINRRGFNRQTPLYVACKHGNLEVVKLLLNWGADPTYQSGVSETELESNLTVAVRWGHLSILETLLNEVLWPRDQFQQAYAESRSRG